MTEGLREREGGREAECSLELGKEGLWSQVAPSHTYTHTQSQLQLGTGIMSFKEGSRKGPGRNPCFFHLYLFDDVIDQWS